MNAHNENAGLRSDQLRRPALGQGPVTAGIGSVRTLPSLSRFSRRRPPCLANREFRPLQQFFRTGGNAGGQTLNTPALLLMFGLSALPRELVPRGRAGLLPIG